VDMAKLAILPELFAYWTDRFGISEEELIEAVRETGGLATNVEVYLSQKRIER
jgi:hypothetical protein